MNEPGKKQTRFLLYVVHIYYLISVMQIYQSYNNETSQISAIVLKKRVCFKNTITVYIFITNKSH